MRAMICPCIAGMYCRFFVNIVTNGDVTVRGISEQNKGYWERGNQSGISTALSGM